MSLLSVRNLSVRFRMNDGYVYAVNDVSFEVKVGQILAIVGESGSGKSQIAFSILGLLAKNAEAKGKILYNNKNLLDISKRELNRIRTKEIAIVFQDPMGSLNPYMKIRKQLSEIVEWHEGLAGAEAHRRVLEVLDAVQIPDARNRLEAYPHELSGGMGQRVAIAMALICKPKLILADEPTTALDVTVQSQILTMLKGVQKEFGTSILLITHDLGVVAGSSDEAIVLYGGRIMEQATTHALFDSPSHPYTRALLKAIPRLGQTDELVPISGRPNVVTAPLTCCPFAPRCTYAKEKCFNVVPDLSVNAPIRACFEPIENLT